MAIAEGSRIRHARQSLGITLRELGEAMGVTAPFLHDVEHGRRQMTDERVKQAAAALGVNRLFIRSECLACGRPYR
jgi:transcriptional regulator with XRE-family HTH domain